MHPGPMSAQEKAVLGAFMCVLLSLRNGQAGAVLSKGVP